MCDMPQNEEPRGAREAVDAGECARLLDGVVAAVDAGELEASGPERAYLVGAAQTLQRIAGSPPDTV